MKYHNVEYVNWFGEDGLQSELIREMGIKEEEFRRYHEVVGGDYKDLWHLWLFLVGIENVRNGGYDEFTWYDTYNDEWKEWFVEHWAERNPYKARDEGKEWILDLTDALDRLMTRLGKDSLLIYYYW